jgi:hypothetical protein
MFKAFTNWYFMSRDAPYLVFFIEGPERRESISNVSERRYRATQFKLCINFILQRYCIFVLHKYTVLPILRASNFTIKCTSQDSHLT